MSENKFIRHLKGEGTAKSLLEVKNQNTPTSFANMPHGTSNANDVYSDHRGNATGVLKGTENWKLDGQDLIETTAVYGDGRDLTSDYEASGNTLWVDTTYTFATARRFNANTKFVLKLCGHDLETTENHTIDFALVVKFGTTPIISKIFKVTEQAFEFCKEFVIDFTESNNTVIKADANSTMQVLLLCADPDARATIYNGMTVFTALQRRVDGDVVASDKKTFDEVVQDIDDINEEIDDIHEDIDDLKDYCDETFLPLTGGTLTGDLAFRYSTSYPVLRIIQSGQNTNHLRFINNNSASQSISFDLSQAAIHPLVSGRGHLGTSNIHFGDAYIDKVYTGVINNGYDISVPVTTSADTFALVNTDINPLQQQINHLQTIGRFLSFWDATTGLAQTNPQTSPYVYQTGDYFRVGVVAGPGGTNYKPSGSSYTIGVASTTLETERLSVGQVYYYDGANWALAAGGSVAIDETTITFNNNDEIQAVAVVDQNTGIVKTWTGTAAEYDAIVTKDPDTEYIIIDDIGSSATAIGQITEALNDKVDKGHEVIEFQEPNAGNNYTWYRKYADGWVEQGGRTTVFTNTANGTSNNKTVVLPITMLDANYNTITTRAGGSSGWSWRELCVSGKTATQFTIEEWTNNTASGITCYAEWQVSGMAA